LEALDAILVAIAVGFSDQLEEPRLVVSIPVVLDLVQRHPLLCQRFSDDVVLQNFSRVPRAQVPKGVNPVKASELFYNSIVRLAPML
jgi:hypothetical protein